MIKEDREDKHALTKCVGRGSRWQVVDLDLVGGVKIKGRKGRMCRFNNK